MKFVKNLNVKVLDSWSKYHCYKQDKWEAFLKYVLHEKKIEQMEFMQYQGVLSRHY